PDSSELSAMEALAYPAVQLFVERATSAAHRFEFRDADASVVSKICRKLDGIPLAIELAAGRVDVFGTLGVATRLEDRIRLLTQGRRTARPRHRTLEATLDWSFDALPEPEQTLLCRLAVFAGDFTLDAADAVATYDPLGVADIAELVASLVSKSLLNAEVGTGFALYRLLDTTRAYALQKLQEKGETDACARRHASYFRSRLETAGTDNPKAPAIGPTDIDEARVALDWAFANSGDVALGVALADACLPLWSGFSLAGDCCRYVTQAVRALKAGETGNDLVTMRLLAALGAALIYTKGPGPEADAVWAEALAIAQSHHDSEYEIRTLWGMWSSHFNSGQYLASLDIGRRFREAATSAADHEAALIGDRIVAVSMFYLGDHTGARQTIDSMLGHYVRPRARSHILRFQFDQRVVARTVRARLNWALGFPDQALQEAKELIGEATEVDHAMSLCLALAQAACPVTLLCGDMAAAQAYIELLVRHSAQNGLDIWHSWGKCFSAMLLIEHGNIDRGLKALYRALDELPQGAFYMRYTGFQGALAQALGTAGEVSNGLATIEDVLARCDRNNERWYIAECARIKGELLRQRRTPHADEEARAEFVRSIDLARDMQTPSWELRAVVSLARLLRDHGRMIEAREVLAPVYDRFAEGFETADLQSAGNLLGEL
ncbi:MAG TPA: hypothetical protein VMB71_13445, partial [Acetobacteraceae bacterium]|nr:hypothetical protein [Acetobacteraceae bacterium]